MNLGKRILEIRKEHKLSQEEFSELFNVTRQTVSSWENQKSYPDIETLVKISDKFNVSLDILLKENKEMVININKQIKNNKKLKIAVFALAMFAFIITILLSTENGSALSEKEIAINQIVYNEGIYSFNGESNNFVVSNGKIDFSVEKGLILITDFSLKDNSKIDTKRIKNATIWVYFDNNLWAMVEYDGKEDFEEWLNEVLLLEMVSYPCRENYQENSCEIVRSSLIDKSLFPNNMKLQIDYCIDSNCINEFFEVVKVSF